MSEQNVELRFQNTPLTVCSQNLFCKCGATVPLRYTGYIQNAHPPHYGHVCDGVNSEGQTCGSSYYLPDIYPKIVYMPVNTPPAPEPEEQKPEAKKWKR